LFAHFLGTTARLALPPRIRAKRLIVRSSRRQQTMSLWAPNGDNAS
jgi:hypothetical protein